MSMQIETPSYIWYFTLFIGCIGSTGRWYIPIWCFIVLAFIILCLSLLYIIKHIFWIFGVVIFSFHFMCSYWYIWKYEWLYWREERWRKYRFKVRIFFLDQVHFQQLQEHRVFDCLELNCYERERKKKKRYILLRVSRNRWLENSYLSWFCEVVIVSIYSNIQALYSVILRSYSLRAEGKPQCFFYDYSSLSISIHRIELNKISLEQWLR